MQLQCVQQCISKLKDRNWLTTLCDSRNWMRCRIGRNDVAYRLLLQTSFPSWGFCIANGATSVWERWDSWTPDKVRSPADTTAIALRKLLPAAVQAYTVHTM